MRWLGIGLVLVTTAVGCAANRNEDVFTGQLAASRGDYLAASLHLRKGLGELDEPERLSAASRHSLVLELARVQLCMSAQYARPELAHATRDMLVVYEENLRAQADARYRVRQAAYALREAEIAADSPKTWAIARCRRLDPQRRPATRGGGGRSRYVSSWGMVYRSAAAAGWHRRNGRR